MAEGVPEVTVGITPTACISRKEEAVRTVAAAVTEENLPGSKRPSQLKPPVREEPAGIKATSNDLTQIHRG